MSPTQKQIEDVRKEVDARLHMFDGGAYSIGELDGYVRAIAGDKDPDDLRWITGAASTGSEPPKAPDFIKGAHEIVHQPDVRHRLCAALASGTGDMFDIGKTLVPVLIPLSLAGAIAVPVTPIVIAAIALVIARMGVGAFCKGAP
jgi:hypothetical protein